MPRTRWYTSRRHDDPTIVCDEGRHVVKIQRGMIAIVPKGTWPPVRSAEGGTTWSATAPGDHIEHDVFDDTADGEPEE